MIQWLFIFCILVLSQAATLIRFAEASSLAICFWRLLIATLLLSPLALHPHRLKGLKDLSRHDWLQLALSGAFLFTHFYSFFRSVQETTVASATILICLSPVSTAIGAFWFFRERVTVHLAAACLLGMSGIAVLFGESYVSHPAALSGDAWGVVSAFCFSGYVLTGKHVRGKLANSLYTFSIYLQTSVYAFIFMGIFKVPLTGYSQQTWIAFVALAILPTLMGHAIFTYCLNYLNVNFMSCITLVEPILSAIAARYLFNEKLTEWATLGFLLTAASVLVLYWEAFLSYFKRTLKIT